MTSFGHTGVDRTMNRWREASSETKSLLGLSANGLNTSFLQARSTLFVSGDEARCPCGGWFEPFVVVL